MGMTTSEESPPTNVRNVYRREPPPAPCAARQTQASSGCFHNNFIPPPLTHTHLHQLLVFPQTYRQRLHHLVSKSYPHCAIPVILGESFLKRDFLCDGVSSGLGESTIGHLFGLINDRKIGPVPGAFILRTVSTEMFETSRGVEHTLFDQELRPKSLLQSLITPTVWFFSYWPVSMEFQVLRL